MIDYFVLFIISSVFTQITWPLYFLKARMIYYCLQFFYKMILSWCCVVSQSLWNGQTLGRFCEPLYTTYTGRLIGNWLSSLLYMWYLAVVNKVFLLLLSIRRHQSSLVPHGWCLYFFESSVARVIEIFTTMAYPPLSKGVTSFCRLLNLLKIKSYLIGSHMILWKFPRSWPGEFVGSIAFSYQAHSVWWLQGSPRYRG